MIFGPLKNAKQKVEVKTIPFQIFCGTLKRIQNDKQKGCSFNVVWPNQKKHIRKGSPLKIFQISSSLIGSKCEYMRYFNMSSSMIVLICSSLFFGKITLLLICNSNELELKPRNSTLYSPIGDFRRFIAKIQNHKCDNGVLSKILWPHEKQADRKRAVPSNLSWSHWKTNTKRQGLSLSLFGAMKNPKQYVKGLPVHFSPDKIQSN